MPGHGTRDRLRAANGFTFLEANPCGQWDWIEHATGLDIARAIADELRGVPG